MPPWAKRKTEKIQKPLPNPSALICWQPKTQSANLPVRSGLDRLPDGGQRPMQVNVPD